MRVVMNRRLTRRPLLQIPHSAGYRQRPRAERVKRRRSVAATREREFDAELSASRESFVGSFRQASPYIVKHAESLFVVVIPGEVIAQEALFYALLADLQLLHSLGVQLVVIVGSRCLIDTYLEKRQRETQFYGKFRITDAAALEAAIHVASEVRMKTEGFFSRAPSVPLMRRHGTRNSTIATRTVSGNFTAAKARGIVEGIDFGSTGDVRFVSCQPIRDLLHERNIVLLNNLGYSASGDVLNCNTYDVAFHTAVQLKADKLICLHLEQLDLPTWLPLDDAFELFPPHTAQQLQRDRSPSATPFNGAVPAPDENRLMWDFELSERAQLPSVVITSILSCYYGVRRAHLINAEVDGGLLLELYTRDGIGTMISSDFHEGIRGAVPQDMLSVEQLLKPLMENGITIPRSYESLLQDVENFRVFEKEQRVLGCALVKRLDAEGTVAELAALCVHPDCRGEGKGDALLTYIERELASTAVEQLAILTTRTADWFVQRGFVLVGPAHLSRLLPACRLAQIDPRRNAQLYIKTLRKPRN